MKKRFTMTDLIIIILVLCLLALLIIPSVMKARDKAKQRSCIANMKGHGTAFSMYFSSGIEEFFPVTFIANSNIQSGAGGVGEEFQFHSSAFNCRAKHKTPVNLAAGSENSYQVGATIQYEQSYTAANKSDSVIIDDSSTHENTGTVSRLMGDGSVTVGDINK